ncbi:P-loop ATPase [Candidatus Protofrankia californiensis]|uniref:p-loop ATPase n=1 Tax=Candidatus Protofrankia californiensis TaxID=1839754 RepID=A0A1C3NU04_9ACTN|nr:P-loop ATPase [Candidatus Protofrankia californiensis]
MPEALPHHTPYSVSAALLAREEMRAACAARDFAAIFLLIRKYDHIGQDRIAASIEGFSQPRISRIVTGKARVEDLDVIERIADGLRIPGGMLGLATRPWEIAPDVARPRGRDPLRVPVYLRDAIGVPTDAPPVDPRHDEVTETIHRLLATVETPTDDSGGSLVLPSCDLRKRILSAWSSGRPREGAPVLLLVAGFAGSGKTEFARFVSEITGWTLLDKDTVSRPLTESLLLSLDADPNDRQTAIYRDKVRPLEYRCLFDAVFDNLQLGISTVVTAPFLQEVASEPWLQRLKSRCVKRGAEIAVVWMRCDVDSMRDYLETRDAARDSWKLSYWDDYVASINLDQRPVCTHFVVDNGRHAKTNLAEQARQLASRVRDAS